MRPINVGLLGIGTVGGGTFAVLRRNQEEITRRAGRAITLKVVADKDLDRARRIVGDAAEVTADAFSVVRNPEIDIVVELIGGTKVAKDLIMQAIENGKHVVTANKALLAQHGTEIFSAAQSRGVMVAFEAAVAGGIPIIKALREGLTANRIEWIAGIINGTSNFILSEMRDKGRELRGGSQAGAGTRLRRGRPYLRHRGHRRRSQAHHHVRHRLRHPHAVQQGLYGRDIQADPPGHSLRRGTGLPDQVAGHHTPHPKRASSCVCIRP